MAGRLATITLKVKDYASHEYGTFTYHGEVIEINKATSFNLYRFYETDAGTLQVSIDYSKDVIKITESNDNVNMVLFLKKDEYEKCIYQLDASKYLSLITRCFEASLEDNLISLDYDLYDSNDTKHVHPLTRNEVKIEVEGGKKC